MINLTNLREHYHVHQAELDAAVRSVLDSGIYLMGPQLVQFEDEFAHYIGVDHAIGVHSGTDALTLALKSLRLGLKDDCIVPTNAYPTVFGVVASRAHLRLCDVDSKTMNMSLDSLLPSLTKRTKAIVVVHLYGMPAPIQEIAAFAKKHGIYLIEDCAQAAGASVDNQRVGSFGDIGCFSFYPTKNLAAIGDGGAITTNSPEIAKTIRQLRMYGEDVRYHSLFPSTHSRLDELQAAVLRVRLAHLDSDIKKRQKIMSRYRWELQNVTPVPAELPRNVSPAWHLCVVKTGQRDRLREYLREKGIETAIHYPIPIHLQPAFRKLKKSGKSFPVADLSCQEILTMPFSPYLSRLEQDQVIEAVNSWK